MYDLFFVSYNEPNADENWQNLVERFPHARRVHGIKGIASAHKQCARLSYTRLFWTVDGDTLVDETWDFDYDPPDWDLGYLHLWYSRNPINGLSYGYGAIKLWPRRRVLDHDGSWLDFTSSIGGIKIMERTIATTLFNSSPFEAWKSAFRECVKLCHNIRKNPADMESRNRLRSWTLGDSTAENASWCYLGARQAQEWYASHGDTNDLTLINDFDWLLEKFSQTHLK